MIKIAVLEAALAKVKGMMPEKKDQLTNPLAQADIGALAGLGAGTVPVGIANRILQPLKAPRFAAEMGGPEAMAKYDQALATGLANLSSKKQLIAKVLLALQKHPHRTMGGFAAVGGATGLAHGLMAKKSSSKSFYLCGFIQKCAEAGMNEEQIKQAFLGRLGKSIGSMGRMFGQARSGLPTNILQAQHPDLMHRAAKGVGSLFGKAERSPVGVAAKEIGKGVGESVGSSMSPLIRWIKQHPMYAGGVGLGTAGAGAGLQSAIGDMSE